MLLVVDREGEAFVIARADLGEPVLGLVGRVGRADPDAAGAGQGLVDREDQTARRNVALGDAVRDDDEPSLLWLVVRQAIPPAA